MTPLWSICCSTHDTICKERKTDKQTYHTSFIWKQIEWNARQYWIVVIKLACKSFTRSQCVYHYTPIFESIVCRLVAEMLLTFQLPSRYYISIWLNRLNWPIAIAFTHFRSECFHLESTFYLNRNGFVWAQNISELNYEFSISIHLDSRVKWEMAFDRNRVFHFKCLLVYCCVG